MFEEILAKIGKLLKELQVPYMIIGGQAVLLYGEPRLTKDIDITLGLDTSQTQKILQVLNKINLKPLPDNISDFVNNTFVLPTEETNKRIRVDFIFSKTEYEKQAIKRAVKIKIKGQAINFAAIEDLIIHKIFAGRQKDLEDIRMILIKNPDIDQEYIKKWLNIFGNSLNKDFSGQFNNLLKNIG